MEKISGAVDSVVYENSLNGYAVLKLTDDGGASFTAVGSVPRPAAGERITADGVWVTHANFGRQFQIEKLSREMPSSKDGLLAYLKSGALPGVGASTAKAIVDKFGAETLTVIEDAPERLLEIKGMSPKRAAAISEACRERTLLRRIAGFLAAHNLPPRCAMPLFKLYGTDAVEAVTENPYLLNRPPFEIEFEKTDLLAEELGIAPDDDSRIKAGLLYELYFNMNSGGHCFIPRRKLEEIAGKLLCLEPDFSDVIEELCDEGDVVREDDNCYLAQVYRAEVRAAERVARLTAAPPLEADGDELQAAESSVNVTLAPEQREALKTAAGLKLFVLTGGPGTGKTTTVRALTALLSARKEKLALCAPTGRAAKRLSEVCGKPASTIHRLLGAEIDDETGELTFRHCAEEPLPFGTVIADEASMIDILLFDSLLDALKPGAALILVGDADQLPSVGPGSVLSDLLSSGRVSSVKLEKIFRQAEESRIITGAHAVNRGETPPLDNAGDMFFLTRNDPASCAETIADLCLRRLPQNMGIPTGEIQVLTPTRKGECGSIALNERLQAAINPPGDKNECRYGAATFRDGDRVMQVKNDYDLEWTNGAENGAGVFNGDPGRIAGIDKRAERLTVEFDDGRRAEYPFDLLNRLDLAYAITVHKSQGSEYRAAVLALAPCAKSLTTRRVLYTAMTRAKELLVMAGSREVFGEMIRSGGGIKRYCGLRGRLS